MPAAPASGTTVETPHKPESEPRPHEKAAVETNVPVSAPASQPSVPASTAPLSAEAQRMADIERILEEDLADIYFKLPEAERAEFRRTGEETARQINTLLAATSIKVKKIIDLIRDWLKLIPGVNRFFLDQEAKIKADRLLKLNGKN